MLAYVFWHRPRPSVRQEEYEASLRAFHDSLDLPSASYGLDRLPFAPRAGYEDWYLIDDWGRLGVLNSMAVDALHRSLHDAVASLSAEGWGAIYALTRGASDPPQSAHWVDRPAGQSYESFLDSVRAEIVWQRQLVLGPAPEFCLAGHRPQPGRKRV